MLIASEILHCNILPWLVNLLAESLVGLLDLFFWLSTPVKQITPTFNKLKTTIIYFAHRPTFCIELSKEGSFWPDILPSGAAKLY